MWSGEYRLGRVFIYDVEFFLDRHWHCYQQQESIQSNSVLTAAANSVHSMIIHIFKRENKFGGTNYNGHVNSITIWLDGSIKRRKQCHDH